MKKKLFYETTEEALERREKMVVHSDSSPYVGFLALRDRWLNQIQPRLAWGSCSRGVTQKWVDAVNKKVLEIMQIMNEVDAEKYKRKLK